MTVNRLWESLADLPIHPSWVPALEPVAGTIIGLGEFLAAEAAAGRGFLPDAGDIFRAFSYPFENVQVLILGQDPYPTPGHAMGLSFATRPGVRPLPRSLRNIFTELAADTADTGATDPAPPAQGGVDKHPGQGTLGFGGPADGDLRAWSEQGVMLLNRVLSVSPGLPGSHQGHGWEKVTAAALTALAARGTPLVAILWGRQAQQAQAFLGDTPCICSPHPSPLSAARGFFGSRPFSRANEILGNLGARGVNWRL